jgi:hypothetical protein
VGVGKAIGEVLPQAIGVVLSPVRIIAIVLLLVLGAKPIGDVIAGL